SPLYRSKHVAREKQNGLAVGVLLLSFKEWKLVHTVNCTIGWNSGSCRRCNRRQEVDLMHDFIGNRTRWDVSNPSDETWRSDSTFQDPVVETAPRARRTAPRT